MAFSYLWMSFLIYFVAFPSLVYLTVNTSGRLSGNETDRVALLNIKKGITSDPYRVLRSWNNTIHFCEWFGVTCGRLHKRVTKLYLRSLKLEGTISPQIGNLSFLRRLDLTNNSFTHQIPTEIGYLHRLERLDLALNSLSGEIPYNLSKCTKLEELSLVHNMLVGKIPQELGSVSKLQFLSLSENNLIGEIPLSLGNLSSLNTLSLDMNNLFGNIPENINQLKQLTVLQLATNQLSGVLPPSIFNLSALRVLDLGVNQLRGHLSHDLCFSFSNIEFLSLSKNQFTGSIPNSLTNASNLESLQLELNNLAGKVPPLWKQTELQLFLISYNSFGTRRPDDLNFLCSLSNASALRILDISSNQFGGVLPECISNFSTKLSEFWMHDIEISGKIPSGIQNLIGLTTFQVYDNKLSGTIPASLGNLQNLVEVILDHNNFSGEIPASLGRLSKLNTLYMGANNLQGNIPSNLGNCTSLLILDLSQNNLTGTLPSEVFGITSLSIYLSFSQNHLIGQLPLEVGQLTNLELLDVADNLLSGEIPSTLASCTSLQHLNMANNVFRGVIPSTLSSLKGLEVVNFSYNNLSGEIPPFLGTFSSLIYLGLSYNKFEGKVPSDGVFTNLSGISLVGNGELCGGISVLHLPSCDLKRSKKKRFSTKDKLVVLVIFGILGAITLVFVLFMLKFRRKKQRNISSIENSLVSLLQVTYQDLHRATNGFSSENLVGLGSFASVYKGVLSEGLMVAVKVLNLEHYGALKSFMVECEALRSIRHRNLVKIITACSSIDYQGNNFKALIYEFMPNGTLEEWLHPQDEAQEIPKKLDFMQRLSIALDVAFAIQYLHHECERSIVHCDLKPSNVLLDNEMTGHVADFGIAKFLVKDIEGTSTKEDSSTTGLRGTIGYAAPEYGVGSEVSKEGDIYSYGILLLEMFTGKRPTNSIFKDGWSLHQYVKCALPSKVEEIIDPSLKGDIIGISNKDYLLESLASIINVGLACAAQSPRERMNISDVIATIHFTKKHLKKIGYRGNNHRSLNI